MDDEATTESDRERLDGEAITLWGSDTGAREKDREGIELGGSQVSLLVMKTQG